MSDADTAGRPLWADGLVGAARDAGEDVDACVELVRVHGRRLPPPGRGHTVLRWGLLSEVSAQELTTGRILEAHSDALAILDEAGCEDRGGTWGVFAAEAPGVRLESDGMLLHGTKPWCSLAGKLDYALVTAHIGAERGLFAVDLHHESVRVDPPSGWIARGLRNVPSGPVHFDGTPARAVGVPGWYLKRPGFAWGGMGVAACWYGGATALAATLKESCAKRGGDLSALYVGAVDVALHGARATLLDAARQVDQGSTNGAQLGLQVRAVVADAVERTLTHVAHALGPAPLAFDEQHARRVADLEIYVRQHHAERDLAALGSALLDARL